MAAPVENPARPAPTPSQSTRQEQLAARSQYLFRAAHRSGQINPLQHIVLRYRLETRA